MGRHFTTWRHKGVQFLATDTGNGTVCVVDEDGNNYGAWYTPENCRARQRKDTCPPIGEFVKLRVMLHF